MLKTALAALVLVLAAPLAARADDAADLPALRAQMEAMRAAYEARLQSLEQRLQRAESAIAGAGTGAGASPAAPPAARQPSTAVASTSPPATQSMTPAIPTAIAVEPPPEPAAAAVVASPNAPPAGAATGGANAFNPAMSLILSGIYAHTSQDPSRYAITGFSLPRDLGIGPGTRGFSLNESELGLAASIDPYLRGAANIALEADNSVSVEEAYVQTTSLGDGFSLKAGRFFSGVGYLNPQHSHTWDFVDNPLAYQAMLGTQYGDDGMQLTWLPPIDQYVEFGLELGRGRSFPGTDTGRNGAGMAAVTAHTGGDIGDSSSWRAGLSMLGARATDQPLAETDALGNQVNDAFSGHTRVWIADAIWKWAPNGNATRTNFKLQGEYLHSTRSGDLAYDIDHLDRLGDYRASQSGWYVQGVYQFMPYWRVGLRTERLAPGSADYGINAASFSPVDYNPRKNTVMLDFSPSEFSRVRLQFARDQARQGGTDNQVFVQYQMSLGAHGAHSY